MGGRGRGKAAFSFNVELLGIGRGEALPGPVLQPPPSYPLLDHNPCPLLPSLDHMARLKYKIDYLKFYSRLKVECGEVGHKRTIEGESAASDGPGTSSEKPVQLDYNWSRFPMELRPSQCKRKKVATTPAKPANIEELLAHLEKAEKTIKVEKPEDDKKDGKKEEEEAEEFEEEESDEEMDGGTDYNQNYFDNGEGYLDEDDDNDDGPIY